MHDLRPDQKSSGNYASRLPSPLARLTCWLVAHHMTQRTIADTPHSIALGSAIGIFFGFTPLYPLKTLLSIGAAWVCCCNKIAAAIAVTLHDVVIWATPAIYIAEYQLGCWSLQRPPAQRVHFRQFGLHDYVHWHVFSRVVWPTFLAGVCWLNVPRGSFGNHYLISHALTGESRSDAAEEGVSQRERSPRRLLNALANDANLQPTFCAFDDW